MGREDALLLGEGEREGKTPCFWERENGKGRRPAFGRGRAGREDALLLGEGEREGGNALLSGEGEQEGETRCFRRAENGNGRQGREDDLSICHIRMR